MRERPDGVRLLELARAAVLDELLPALPAKLSYSARLAANAMAIAARELESGSAAREAEREGLGRLLGDDKEALPGLAGTETLDEALQRLTWRLAAEIRGGGRDADPRTFAILREGAIARLEIANPRALSGDDKDG
jgi:Domain of unknown function (DUF6285)